MLFGHLRQLLTGEALIACDAVPTEQSDCYMTAKESILTRFGVDQKDFRRRWWNANRKPEETCVQFGNCIRDLGLKYIEGCKSPLDVMEAFSIDLILNSLSEHVACCVKEKKPNTVIIASKVADEYITERRLPFSALDKQRQICIDNPRNFSSDPHQHKTKTPPVDDSKSDKLMSSDEKHAHHRP